MFPFGFPFVCVRVVSVALFELEYKSIIAFPPGNNSINSTNMKMGELKMLLGSVSSMYSSFT